MNKLNDIESGWIFVGVVQCVFILSMVMLAGCMGGSLKPADTVRKDAKQIEDVKEGTIIQIVDVTIRGNTEAAQAAGGLLGGYAANRATRDQDEVVQVLASAGGLLVGTIVGDSMSDLALDKPGVNLLVKSRGRIIAITQQVDRRQNFKVNDNVWIIGSGKKVRVLLKD